MESGKLAILGGEPVRQVRFPREQPDIASDEVEAIVSVLESRRLSMFSNNAVEQFERELAEHVGVEYAIMSSSCTAAMHMALVAADVGPGDRVLVPAITYIATANAVMMSNAAPVFVDIELGTYSIDPAQVEEKISPEVKAMIAVDLFGNPVRKDEVLAECEKHDLILIEDCAHAIGASYQGKSVGSFGIGCFSFSEGKNITTGGEGGMITTHDRQIYHRTRMLRHEGEIWNDPTVSAADFHVRTFGEFIRGRETLFIGYNYRPTAIQAAMGLCQLRKLDTISQHRISIAEKYIHDLQDVPELLLPKVDPGNKHVFNRFVVLLNTGLLNLSRDCFLAALVAEGVPAGVYRTSVLPSYPVFRKRQGFGGKDCPFSCQYGRRTNYESVSFPNAERFCADNLQLPLYPNLQQKDVDDVAEALAKIVSAVHRDEELEQKIRERLRIMRIQSYSGEFIYPPVEFDA